MPTRYRYGWKPSIPGKTRTAYQLPAAHVELLKTGSFPQIVSLENSLFPRVDQGQIGSCTGNGTGGAMKVLLTEQQYPFPFFPSRLMIYYNARSLEGTTMQDAGATIADAVAGVNQWGVCPEDSKNGWNWPYWTWMYQAKPLPVCYKDALVHRGLNSATVTQDRNTMLSVLSQGLPIIIGISVYDSFESQQVANTGIVPMPGSNENLLGGHCLFVWGIDQGKDIAYVRNSWGDWGWADHTGRGNCSIPLDYLCNQNLASDFHTISKIGFAK